MIRDRAEPAIEAMAALLTAVPAALVVWSGATLLAPPAPVAAPRVILALTMQPSVEPPLPVPPQTVPPQQMQARTALAAPQPVPVRLPIVAKPFRPVHRRAGPVAAASPAALLQAVQSRPVTREVAAPASQAAPVANSSADALYTGQVHAVVERHKRNPDSAAYRMLHPSGAADVVFTIARDGAVSDVRVVAGTGSDMLDRQAALIVTFCTFPPMPKDAFAGTAAHQFQMRITFPPPYTLD